MSCRRRFYCYAATAQRYYGRLLKVLMRGVVRAITRDNAKWRGEERRYVTRTHVSVTRIHRASWDIERHGRGGRGHVNGVHAIINVVTLLFTL